MEGAPAAISFSETLCEDYLDKALACFLCDRVVESSVFSEIVGDIADPKMAIAAPLCADCRDLPQLVRWNRTMRTPRMYFRRRTGSPSREASSWQTLSARLREVEQRLDMGFCLYWLLLKLKPPPTVSGPRI